MQHTLCSRPTRAIAILAMALLGAPPLAAQETGSVSGRVVDSRTLQPIPSAQVFIPELNVGALTRDDGRYLLVNVPAGTHTVRAQLIGFRTGESQVTVAAGATATTDFSLAQDALALDAVVVTGTPGATQRRALGNVVSQVEATEITQQAAISGMQDMLAGRTTGLQFTALSGNVGAGSPIQIRGVGSFAGAREQPLIYVDGVRVNNSATAGPQLGEGSQVSVLDDFNPEDIESIEIIKGPAAASLYGTEASSGVIQIITKRGRDGSPQFNLSVRQGTNFMRDPRGRLGTYWTCPTDDAPGPTDCQNESDLVSYNMYDEANRYIREGYFPWATDELFSNGHVQGYNLDVSGGAQAIRYFLSANYDREEGFVQYNADEALRLRANVNVLFGDHVSLDASTGFVDGFTRFEGATISDGGLWQDLVWSNGFFLDRITPFDDPRGNPRLGGFQEHLPSDVAEIQATRDYSRFTGSATLNYNGPGWSLGGTTTTLTSRAVVGLDRGWDINRNLFPLEDGVVPDHLRPYTDEWASVYSETVTGEMTYSRPITSLLTFDYAATANVEVGDRWAFATSAGAQYYVTQTDRFENKGNGFASPLSTTINQLAQPQMTTTYEFLENKSLGFFVQEAISYDDRIFLTAAMRFDDNSTFGAEAPAVRYPKLSGAWVVSEEGFWNPALVNSLRLRGAWGKAGRQPSALSGLTTYAAIPGPGGSPAVRVDNPGNPKIEPEVSTELELGFDVAVLDDRLSGEFTHYWRRDEQQLLQVPFTSSYGIPGTVDQNLGRIDNWGWEAQVNARVYESRAWSFDLGLTADFTDNEIRELGDYAGSVTDGILVGLPFPNVIVGDWVVDARFDENAPSAGNFTNAFGRRITAECDAGVSLAPAGSENPAQYGTMPGGEAVSCLSIADRNLFAGRAFATHTYGIAPTITLFDGALQITALAQGQYGRTSLDNAHAWAHFYNNSKVARLEDDPVWVAGDRMNGTANDHGKTIFDADFWKLREVAVRYTLPEALVRRTGASRASLAISGRNLVTLWQAQKEIYGHPVTDPEYGDATTLGGGGNFYSVPPLSSINATLRVSF